MELRHNYKIPPPTRIMEPPILAAIISGTVSVFVNIISLVGQYKLGQRNERLRDEKQWRRDTVSVVKELRREALRMDVDGDDDELVQNLIEEVESHLHRIPDKFTGSSIENKLSELCLVNNNYETGNLNRVEFRKETMTKSEEVLDEFEEISSGPDSLY